jgi:alpha-galactosidase
MDRRHFLRAGAISVASLLVSKPLSSQTPSQKSHLMRLPDEVAAIVNNNAIHLRPDGQSRWTYDAVTVDVLERPSTLAVEVEAPGVRLSEVTLRWKAESRGFTRILNDQWERTYGDASWHAPIDAEILPWYFMEFSGGTTSGFGVKTGSGSMCHWWVQDGGLNLTLNTQSGGNGVQLGDRKLLAAEIVVTTSSPGESPFQATRRFVSMMCDKARMPSQPVYGINDWYFTYGRNSEKLILEHTALMAPMAEGLSNRPFSVVDSGWYRRSPVSPDDCCWGDSMAEADKRFGNMETLAERIKQLGMRPGIWTRPLCGGHNDPKTLMLPLIQGRDERFPVLDPTIPENLERIREYFLLYNQWGYELVKFDFTTWDIFGKWGFQMLKDRMMTVPLWSMNDSSRTNAEIILSLHGTIREAAGNTCVISCNTISHLSAGLFELNRIGDDTSGREWERTPRMGVNTLAFRGVHHGALYSADPDCVGLTKLVPWEKNKQWMQLVASSGTPLFVSAQPEAVGNEQKRVIKESFALASRPLTLAEPLDWMERQVPTKWKLDGRTYDFNWD